MSLDGEQKKFKIKMKLFVDDIRNAPNEDWTVARSVTSAIRAILQFEFDEISLDHDISHQVVMGGLSRPYPCEECFCAVAHFISQYWWGRDETEKPKVIIHTSNPAGASEMGAILSQAGIKYEIKMMGLANRLEQEV